MKTPQEKLVAIMQLKENCFKNMGVKIKYLYKQDIKNLMAISNEAAKIIINNINWYLINHRYKMTKPTLSYEICPFCLMQTYLGKESCDGCKYRILHGRCGKVVHKHPKGGLNTWGRLNGIYVDNQNRPTIQDFLNILEE